MAVERAGPGAAEEPAALQVSHRSAVLGDGQCRGPAGLGHGQGAGHRELRCRSVVRRGLRFVRESSRNAPCRSGDVALAVSTEAQASENVEAGEHLAYVLQSALLVQPGGVVEVEAVADQLDRAGQRLVAEVLAQHREPALAEVGQRG